MSKKLEDKVAVITGGTTGIGAATAKLFADHGARVVVTGRNPSTVDVARKEFGDRITVLQSDASKVADLEQLFGEIKQRFGRIDVLFVNVGGGEFRPFELVDEAYFDNIVTLNAKSAYFTVQKALPLLSNPSSIVFNTSILGVKGFPATSVYGASKAFVRQLARSLGAELLPRGVRVNAVSPGPILTPIYDKLGLGDGKDAFIKQTEASNPMKRYGKADEVARAALFLASDDSSYITGTELAVDGGVTQF